MKITKPAGIPLLINDRVDIALASGADGVHIGQHDLPYSEARHILGSEAMIGLTIDSAEDIKTANNLGVDYISIGPVFSTNTKKDLAPVWGPANFCEACEISKHPVVAIGGITAGNISQLKNSRAKCYAVVSEVCAANDVTAAISQLKNSLK